MSQRRRDILTVTVIVAVLLLALWGVLALRRGRAGAAPQPTSGGERVAGPRAAVPSSGTTAPQPKATTVVGEPKATRPSSPAAVEASAKQGAEATPAVRAGWTKREPWACR